jgi:hypothetical protein
MNKVLADRVFAGILLLVVLVFLIMAAQMNSVAGRMPLLVGSFTLILLVAYFVGEFWPRKASAEPRKRPELDEDDENFDEDGKSKGGLDWWDIRVWGWLLVLFVCIYLFGITIGIGVLTALFYRLAAKQSWRGGVVFGILQATILYVIFELVFRTALYPGRILELILG